MGAARPVTIRALLIIRTLLVGPIVKTQRCAAMAFHITDLRTTKNAQPQATEDAAAVAAMAPAERAAMAPAETQLAITATTVVDANDDSK